jgi:hypothetical protein
MTKDGKIVRKPKFHLKANYIRGSKIQFLKNSLLPATPRKKNIWNIWIQ